MIKEGVFLGKRYEILGRIGSGGMADVYKGKDHKLNRYVAIKVLKSDYRTDEVFIQKFLSEAQAAAGLMHPNVVNVYDVGQDRGLYYMVMELVEGITLKDYIEKKGKLSAKETISISIQMVTGLQAAHNQHIIHRDIKPQNIIISKEGKVKVTDFGIARATTSTQTISTSVMGSVHYTSPEQARGGVVDQKSDIYSIGITMYEMVTGHVPFDGDSTVSVALKHLQEEIKSPAEEVPDIPYSLECIILKCTQKNAERRYHDCESLLLDLKRSLVDPDGDFVIAGGAAAAAAAGSSDRTVVMSTEELSELQKRSYNNNDDDDYDEDEDPDDYDEEDEDDRARVSRNRSSRGRRRNNVNQDTKKIMRILMIVAGVVIALLVIFLVANAFGAFNTPAISSQEEKEQVDAPELLGMTMDEAKEYLADNREEYPLGIRQNGTMPSSEYAEGEIMSQDPDPGEKVDVNTTIYVVVSSGEEPKTVNVPNVVGEKEADAEQMLQDANLTVTKDTQYSSEYEAGRVISCDPNEGTEVEEGTAVKLVISLGVEQVEVPNLQNQSASDAESALSSRGLSGNPTYEYSDTVAEGYVISQGTDAGKMVDPGTTINYVVSRGPESVTIPNVIGADSESAEADLTAAGLKVEFGGYETSDRPAEQVCRLSYEPGTSVKRGTTVRYWISSGSGDSGGSDSGNGGSDNPDSDSDNTGGSGGNSGNENQQD